jgi:hypothetical protein
MQHSTTLMPSEASPSGKLESNELVLMDLLSRLGSDA